MKPYVVLSVAVSLDGHIDDCGPERLLLSNDEDFDRVDSVRAESDAILIGAETMRSDNPRLLVKSEARRRDRVAVGRSEYPLKVSVSASGRLSRDLKFWHHGNDKIVYTVDAANDRLTEELQGLAEVVSVGEFIDFARILEDLDKRGVRRLMVEGGGQVHTALIQAGLFDEIHMAVAPVVVGEDQASRFLREGDFGALALELKEAKAIGNIALLRYVRTERRRVE